MKSHRLVAVLGALALLWPLALMAQPASANEASEADETAAEAPHSQDSLEFEADPLFDEDFDLEVDNGRGFPDPIEPVNRGILRFNDLLDRWVMDPITRAYQFVVPDPARAAIHRLVLNLNNPPIFANDVLQLEWRDAGVTISRFAVNSTIGIAGLFDPAARMGLARHDSDFGQTLALAEIPSGPYVVLPVLGPSTARDATGQVVDSFVSPATYFFGFAFVERLIYTGTTGLSERDKHYQRLIALKDSSVDYYSALRSAFYQNREAQIWHRREHRQEDWEVPY